MVVSEFGELGIESSLCSSAASAAWEIAKNRHVVGLGALFEL